jgi:hypothetical protein
LPKLAPGYLPEWTYEGRAWLLSREGEVYDPSALPAPLAACADMHWPGPVARDDPRHVHTAARALRYVVNVCPPQVAVDATALLRTVMTLTAINEVLVPYARYFVRACMSVYRHDDPERASVDVNDALQAMNR